MGNLRVAKLVASALAQAPSEGILLQTASDHKDETPIRGDGHNLVTNPEDLMVLFPSSQIAKIESVGGSLAARAHRISAIGPAGEHYLAAAIPGDGGSLTFSLEARADTNSRMVLQLLLNSPTDGVVEGVLGDFDLRERTATPRRVSRARNIAAGISAVGNSWYKIWVAAVLPPRIGQLVIVVQIANNRGETSFEPDGEAIRIRHVQVEHGNTPSDDR
jgi:hypothetical protein